MDSSAGHRRALLVLLLAAVASLGAGCGSPPGPGRLAILVILDAARADRFSCYGYDRETTPEIDRVAAEGRIFNRHFAQGTATASSLPSLLTSRYFALPLFPTSREIPLVDPVTLFLAPDPATVSLPGAFAEAGYHTVAISAHTWTRPETAFAKQFDELHDLPSRLSHDRRYGYPRAEEVIDYTLDLLEVERLRGAPVFLYLHLMDTHFPHFLDADARRWYAGSPPVRVLRPTGGGRPPEPISVTENERAYLDAIYDGSLRYTDRHLGRLFHWIRKRGRWQDTLVTITSDHGEHLLENPQRFGHGGPSFDPVVRVPLVLSHPRRVVPGRYDGLSEGVDVLPTMLGALGLSLAEGKLVDGIDLLQDPRQRRDAVLLSDGIRTEAHKALFSTSSRDELLVANAVPGPSDAALFDLAADPGEVTDLSAELPDLLANLSAQYAERARRSYRRYRRSPATATPTSSFAVAARHATTAPRIPEAPPHEDRLSVHGRSVGVDGWLRLTHWQLHGLLAGPHAPPVVIEIPLPKGTYALSVRLRGGLGMRLPGGRSCDLVSSADLEERACGEVIITGQSLRAKVAPIAGHGPLFLASFGFRPLTAGAEPGIAEDQEALERLRTLGYVQ